MKIKTVIFLLSLIFTFLSFFPTLYEYLERDKIPAERYFVLEHNYNFDYNFYLSRVREGSEGNFLVSEKYYNQPHSASLFQIVYLFFGRIGKLFSLSAPAIYHSARLIFGFLLLLAVAKYGSLFFKKKSLILFFLLAITAGSWPIIVKAGPDLFGAGGFYRAATYMGWWSVIDSLQRITIMPHILIGQTFLILFIMKFSNISHQVFESHTWCVLLWGLLGLAAGIIFPPTVIIVYVYFAVSFTLHFLDIISLKVNFREKRKKFLDLLAVFFLPLVIFFLISSLSLIYMQLMFKADPWKALALFDIEHRLPLYYRDYFLALGPMLPLGILGMVLVFVKNDKRFYPAASWVLSIALLFAVFENIPQQSPLRFTEGLINVPLAVLAVYFLGQLKSLSKILSRILAYGTVILGLLVMLSMELWLTDQVYAKRLGQWPVPLGAQLAYPLDDFIEAIFYLRDNTKREDVVLAYITAGNYIPAYAGNYVYLGHANTPREDEKEIEVARFFRGEFTLEEAREFLKKERIFFIYFGPQERELASGQINLFTRYNLSAPIYSNNSVEIYKVN